MATVLVVEDDGETRELLSRYLRFMGHRAVAVSNGEEALSALANGPADLILMDMMMPVDDDRRSAAVPVLADRFDQPIALKHLNTTAVLRKTDGFFIDLVDIVAEHLRRAPLAHAALN